MKQTASSLFPWGKEIDISHELYRIYKWESGAQVVIKKPRTLIVSDNGHRIVDEDFVAHYIPYGWIHLWWENVDKEQFQFYFQRERAKEEDHAT
jgi:hypothetical protein